MRGREKERGVREGREKSAREKERGGKEKERLCQSQTGKDWTGAGFDGRFQNPDWTRKPRPDRITIQILSF
jgi:hypothetical protein